jgi:hypothetical protein
MRMGLEIHVDGVDSPCGREEAQGPKQMELGIYVDGRGHPPKRNRMSA